MTTIEKKKYVYDFSEGRKELKNLLGGKGANLGEMSNLGLNVPPGFTITTEACLLYFDNPKKSTSSSKGTPPWPPSLFIPWDFNSTSLSRSAAYTVVMEIAG